MTEPIVPPWKPEEVEALNLYQQAGVMHPFTCANRTDGNHIEREGEDLGLLVATADGWVCKDCDYTQYWAHAFMLEEQARTPLFPWMKR